MVSGCSAESGARASFAPSGPRDGVSGPFSPSSRSPGPVVDTEHQNVLPALVTSVISVSLLGL